MSQKNKKFRSIRVKLVFILSLTAILATLLSSTIQFYSTYQEGKKSALLTLSQTASILGENLSASLEFDDTDSATLILSALKLSESIEIAYLLKDKEDIFSSYYKNDTHDKELIKKALNLYNLNNIKEHIHFSDMDTLIVSEPIYFNEQYLASFMLIANTTKLKEGLKNQLISLLVISGFITLIIILFAVFIQKVFTIPIFSLKDAMDDVRENSNYNTHINFQSNDEFQSLFDGFYRMIETIKYQKEEQKLAQNKIEHQKQFVQTLLDSQEQLIITTNGRSISSANKAFLEFFTVSSVFEFEEKYNSTCICDTFNQKAPAGYLQKMMGDKKWIEYVISNSNDETYKAMITRDKVNFIFSVSAAKLPGEEGLSSAVFTNITEIESAKVEVEAIHRHTRESIEYASMIQRAILPDKKLMSKYFKDNFVYWMPKDTVGGDIWLFDELRHKDECLLFFIDCTGHGVPGAFVTMIVKAIEREIIAKIVEDPNMDVSPAWIMSYFNQTMKVLLKQVTKESKSNAGWDGGVVYYNKKDQILKFAGAETTLFYMDLEGELKTVKGNRYSVGYKKCAMDYDYKETIIKVQEGMKFYCTTDGFLDQNGGEKDFPFGKKRFGNIIKENHAKPMIAQLDVFVDTIKEYENVMAENHDRNDDMTVIAFEIDAPPEYNGDITIEIMKYEGVMTQNILAAAIDNIEANIRNVSVLGYVSTITIEYCQNMMNYSKNEDIGSQQILPAGKIEILYINNEYYEISATNIVSQADKLVIEEKLIEIQGLDKASIKKRYKELRKSGENTHAKGGGIGMYEIAKISDGIEFEFQAINEDKYYFTMKSFVKPKDRRAVDRRRKD